MNLTDKFKSNYLKGFDCRLSTFRNSMACNGSVMSNAMVLGLSGALIFCYNNNPSFKNHNIPLVVGISDQSLEGLVFGTGAYAFRSVFNINDDWKSEIERYLSNNVLVNVAINRVKLQQMCFPERANGSFLVNMGFHFVTITAYDRTQDVFTIFETDSSQEIIISSENLKEIWFYDVLHGRENRDLLRSCNGQWYGVLTGQVNEETIVRAAINGIDRVISNFYNSAYRKQIGIDALALFESEATEWHLLSKDSDLMIQTIHCLRVLSINLSGGGLGRKLYSYFLSELSKTINDDSLKEVAVAFRNTSELWKRYVDGLGKAISWERDKNHVDFSKVRHVNERYVHQIASSERAQMKQLNNWFKSSKYA